MGTKNHQTLTKVTFPILTSATSPLTPSVPHSLRPLTPSVPHSFRPSLPLVTPSSAGAKWQTGTYDAEHLQYAFVVSAPR